MSRALQVLTFMERIYLRVNGWVPAGGTLWKSPPTYRKPGRIYEHGHAVNSQKWTDRHNFWGEL